MAQVTVELGRLLETNFDLFDFEYQFDDPQFKEKIEQEIIDFFYDYEIGQETPDMFKRKFKARFLRMIGYYNELYNTTLLAYNPLTNYNVAEALEQLATSQNVQDSTSNTASSGTSNTSGADTSDSTTTASSTSSSESDSGTNSTRTDDLTTNSEGSQTDNNISTSNTNEKTSDFPQQAIAGGNFLSGERQANTTTDSNGTIQNENTSNQFGTVKNDSTTNTSTTGSDSGTSTTAAEGTNRSTTETEENSDSNAHITNNGTNNMNYSKTIEGITGTSYQELVRKERDNLLRLTNAMIEELKPCFILIY